ncbi:MAG TPA: 4'-phosphopantetheinyl transferase superfamily protein [Daejeonella sp.]|nr:4'-phosphopantetheinyl transferase superfamily protein [Daejeonella sp.]
MALAYQKIIDPHTSFALWKIDETAEELITQLQLKDHERAYLETLNKGKRYLHWLSTRVLLRTMMNTQQYIDCRVDEHGKPYLSNFPHHISLSHSFDYAAVMISTDKKVGIDIEIVKDKIERIARKFMNDSELEFINPAKRTEHLYMCWCAKEAVYKLHGKKQVSFLDHIRLSPFACDIDADTEVRIDWGSYSRSFTVRYHEMDGYMVGYAADKDEES